MALISSGRELSLVNTFLRHERVRVQIAVTGSHCSMRLREIISPFRLRGVHPPSVEPEFEEAFVHETPKEFPGRRIEWIVRGIRQVVLKDDTLIRIRSGVLKPK